MTIGRSSPDPPGACQSEVCAVARAGIEPATFHFSGERCYQLSYLAVLGVRACVGDPVRASRC